MITALLSRFGATGQAQCGRDPSGAEIICNSGLPNVNAGGAQINQILQIVFGALAVVSVLMIALAGLRMITDSSNPQEVAKARNTIIYSVAGLVIAISGELIVIFLLNRLR